MRRDVSKLADTTFDLLIIGGGINGACAAWDATLRGLTVALIDKGDFGAATSANSLKIIHGGLRYLQHADLGRMRESIKERSTLLSIAPHLVHPIPFMIPTYDRFREHKELLRIALKINDIIGFDRNRLNGSALVIPSGKIVSKEECLKIFPDFDEKGLTGGAVWYDCQVHNSERLTLSFLLSAAEKGAVIANYLEANILLADEKRIFGIRAVDQLGGDELEVRARMVLNASGPWVNHVIHRLESTIGPSIEKERLAMGLNVVIRRSITDTGIGMRSRITRGRGSVNAGERSLFLVPWRGYTLIGTLYENFSGSPDDCTVREEDIKTLLNECNKACPGLELRLEDVSFYHQGLLPVVNRSKGGPYLSLAKKHRIIDHHAEQRLSGLISVIGVKYTVARGLAQEVIDLVFRRLGYNLPPQCRTSQIPLYGAEHANLGNLKGDDNSELPACFSEEAKDHLKKNYGGRSREVASYATNNPKCSEPIANSSSILRCEILHAVRAEMALKLSDVIFRRTEMGSAMCPPRSHIEVASQIMATELGWDKSRQTKEINEVLKAYAPLELSARHG